MTDRIAKQRLHVILLVDCSTSMRGERISQVNSALVDIQKNLSELQKENTNVDFYLTVITFSTDARYLNKDQYKNVDEFQPSLIKAGGWSNLHFALEKLEDLLKKESKGGIMSDFGGVAPIVLLLTDGHPTGEEYKKELEKLQTMPWFKVSLRYGIAIELNDERTMKVLKEFVGTNGEVISCYDARLLQRIIKIIVLTASKVKSSGTSLHVDTHEKESINQNVQQQVSEALTEVDNWEW